MNEEELIERMYNKYNIPKDSEIRSHILIPHITSEKMKKYLTIIKEIGKRKKNDVFILTTDFSIQIDEIYEKDNKKLTKSWQEIKDCLKTINYNLHFIKVPDNIEEMTISLALLLNEGTEKIFFPVDIIDARLMTSISIIGIFIGRYMTLYTYDERNLYYSYTPFPEFCYLLSKNEIEIISFILLADRDVTIEEIAQKVKLPVEKIEDLIYFFERNHIVNINTSSTSMSISLTETGKMVTIIHILYEKGLFRTKIVEREL